MEFDFLKFRFLSLNTIFIILLKIQFLAQVYVSNSEFASFILYINISFETNSNFQN
jgi:hypothetical protein